MKPYKVMPYAVLEREDWSVDYLMASLEEKADKGIPLLEWVNINPTRVDKKEIEKTTTYSYLDLSSISHEYGIISNPKEVLGEDLPARATLKVQEGDILLSSVRPERNHVAVVDETFDGCIVNNTFFVLRPKQRNHTELLYFVLRSNDVNEQLSLLARGTAIPTIRKKEIESFQIPDIETTSENQQVAQTLYKDWIFKQQNQQSVQSIVEKRFIEHGIIQTEENSDLPDPLYTTVLSDQVEATRNLKDLLLKARSGAAISSKEYQEEGIPYIRIRDMTGTSVSMEEGVYINEATAENNAKGKVQKGDVLVSRVGTVGKAGFVSDELEEAVASQHISMLQVNQDRLNPLFLLYYLNTSCSVDHLLKLASGSVQKFIRLKDIKELPVPVPDLKLQEQVVQEIERQITEQSNDSLKDQIHDFTEKLLNKSN
ncbi:restriction endonuclease subunit S [Pontibacillus salipaludis]|uniref:Type I restriction modification DNA specificity domain-containing protein n=1 Tax=Pontibacillus salipaludis TaxID=1697394 RepID=A0ABQ1QIH9_9BACI|nr:restriction endonuclease subunit S [Pontibacillus salipaludis]GGD28874.1 hypothetical protein GCM10011389_40590 [Pontibacillus salipaludis]